MKKILYFEREPFLAEMYIAEFKKNGYAIAWYENPTTDPVALAQKEKPDLIMTDILMSVIDGYTAIRLLKTNEATKHIPVIVFSNLSQPKEIQLGKDAGADDYIIKAEVTPGMLISKIDQIFR